MPKAAPYLLTWIPEQQVYALSSQGQTGAHLFQREDERWFAWLATCSSFAFQGQYGHLTLRKENRKRGAGYWYAYRTQNQRTRKRYVGRSEDLMLAHLEECASRLTGNKQPPTLPLTPVPMPKLAPLLEPKLCLPRLQASLVARPHLLTRLNASLQRKLTLISAPAGFGKTTLVRQWVSMRHTREKETERVAWISLDTDDTDPVRFWSYVVTACQVFRPGIGQSVLSWLSVASQPPFPSVPLETILTSFLNDLASYEGNGLLILDDYHVITEPRIHATLTFVLDHLPPTLHLILIARGAPPLPLPRWRACNELCEVLAGDLRFLVEEMQTFLHQELPFALSAEAIKQLAPRLEGWPVGLRLLTFLLQGRANQAEVETLLSTFSGEQQSVFDYFVTEVLDTQPEPLQRFLLLTSVLSRLTSSLCAAVAGDDQSEHLLSTLNQAHLFLESLDGNGHWYRYHALFAEAMRREARQRLGEEALCLVLCKASFWYEEHGLLEEAVEAALQAQDAVHAATLMTHIIDFNALMYVPTLSRWLKHLPENVLKQYPTLCLSYAITQFFIHVADLHLQANRTHFRALLEEPLHQAEHTWQASGDIARLGEVFAFRALLASSSQEEMQEAVNWARQALDCLPEKQLAWRSTCMRIMGLFAQREGQLNAARRFFREACTLSKTIGNRPIARVTTLLLGQVSFEQAELHQAAAYYQHVLHEARAQNDPTDMGPALLYLAQLAYECNDLHTAQQYVQEAATLAERMEDEELQGHVLFHLARIQHALGHRTEAQEHLARLFVCLQPFQPLYQEALLLQARFQLDMGDVAAVQRSYLRLIGEQERRLRTPAVAEQEELLHVRLRLSTGEAHLALEQLQRLLPSAQEAGRVRRVLEIHLLMALAYAALKQMLAARQQACIVLGQACSEEYLRFFLDEGKVIVPLLRHLLGNVHEKPLRAYLRRILHAFASEPGQPPLPSPASLSLLELLSPQEQRVLSLLTAGHSNPEIARSLVVSVNTVRTQVQSIYRKLGVNNRVAASEAARSLRLLS
ncbi:LuxR C-terminal-related transcriptional regulator [Ktedonospora formicarum]|uniref:LuxR family transcriptional regulator n=1 Tax=Ktedonospora formicarum TaxID=2778364 RepID=A0A8J3ID31_9CHLR|nr:LuxR C-terminal-related transcriptional regulator [Ktedonospora formicarum]GHO50527.1 LuxR family transcriptional regulator [Ktedonospora formicarum]